MQQEDGRSNHDHEHEGSSDLHSGDVNGDELHGCLHGRSARHVCFSG
jgi:hypothetical protein